MATGTAYYNLTKPASNENYNLATWNTNLDMIDAQMHQNETETFTGATSLANGTVGNVPAPLIADKDKYLKGDGTWDTPSGGGGGSSTLDGLTDVSISSPTNGQALVYDATNQIWVNGDVSGGGGTAHRVYLGELCPRVTAEDSHITASSEGGYRQTVWYAWGAFSSTPITNWTIPQTGSAWVDSSESTPWIMYHFDEPRYFTQITISCGSNYSGAYSGSIYIEASNDGTTWTDIGNGLNTINAPLQSINDNTYQLDDINTWEYIRVKGAQSFFIANSPSCFIQSIQVYGGKISTVDVTDIDFSDLSATQADDILGKLDFTHLTAQQIADLKTALGIS